MKIIVKDNYLQIILQKNLVASSLDEQMDIAKKAIHDNPQVETFEMNLEHVKEIDSLGINLVVGLYKQINNLDKKFCVTNTAASIQKLFKLFKLNTYFEIS